MNNNPYIHCSEFGLPHLRLYYDGSMFHELKHKWIKPQPCSNNVELLEFNGTERVRVSFNRLYGFYFRAPWTQRVVPRYRWLTPLGLSNYCILEDGRLFSLFNYEYMCGTVNVDGYHRVLLTADNGDNVYTSVHRLVAIMYIPNPENKPEVNHIDGNKLNNHISNLEWTWPYENMEHALNTGLRYRSMSDETIHQICQMLERGDRVLDIMNKLNIPKHSVLGIKSGCHARISRQYNIPRNEHFSKHRTDWALGE